MKYFIEQLLPYIEQLLPYNDKENKNPKRSKTGTKTNQKTVILVTHMDSALVSFSPTELI